MVNQNPWCVESRYYCVLGETVLVTNMLQTVISIVVPISIWKYREVDGFSINFQFCYLMALAFKYIDNRAIEHLEFPDTFGSIFDIQHTTKVLLLMMMMNTFVLTVCFAKHDKFNVWWNTRGIVVSLVFALDHPNLDLTVRDCWMIGSFMDIIAWTALFKVFSKSKTYITESYFVLMFLDHLLKVFHANYDTYRDKFYANVGCKLDLLNLLLYCCFIIQWVRDHIKIKIEVNANIVTKRSSGTSEPSICDSTEKCPKKLIYCIENEKNTSNDNKHGLLLPN